MKAGEKGWEREGRGVGWDLYRCRTEMACSVPFVKLSIIYIFVYANTRLWIL